MRPVHVCTTVFSQYALLCELLESVKASTRLPESVYIIDHGYDSEKLKKHITGILPKGMIQIVTLPDPGCAHAANWLYHNVPDDRICVGDDITFHPEAIERLAATEGEFILPKPDQNVFACYLMRNVVLDRIGEFDEKISPQYLYYEDTDYQRRMDLATPPVPKTFVEDAIVYHKNGGSQTFKNYTCEQLEVHHKLFRIATRNYVKKWGGMPFRETLTVPEPL